MSEPQNKLRPGVRIIKHAECRCDKLATAQAAERERVRREEADNIRRELMQIARRVEQLTKVE